MKSGMNGSMAVEAAIGLPILVVLIFFWIELCLMIFSMSMIDHAITTSVIEVKKTGESSQSVALNYHQIINDKLNEAGSILGINVVDQSSIGINVSYLSDFGDLVRCDSRYQNIVTCPHISGSAESSPLAIYGVNYRYQPIVSPWFPGFELRREIMTVQEYERCEFKFNKGSSCG